MCEEQSVDDFYVMGFQGTSGTSIQRTSISRGFGLTKQISSPNNSKIKGRKTRFNETSI